MKIAVIGGGGVGSAAARHLARDGHDVVVLEQFSVDHDRGSSYGESRVTRKTYADELLTELMTAAYPLWDDLQAEAGEELFVRAGGLYFGPEGHPDLVGIEAALAKFGVPYDRLSVAEAQRRFPAFRLKSGEIGIAQADTGFLRASACVRANLRLAVQYGAEIREQTVVRSFAPEGSGFRIQTEQGDLFADRLVVTAGPWLARLVNGLPLVVSRQQYVHLKPARNEDLFKPGAFPVWIEAKSEAVGEMYGFPIDGRVPGVKLAQHRQGPSYDPDHVDRELDPNTAEMLRAYARDRMPDLSDEISFSKTCLYTNTPDRIFILDEVPGRPGAVTVGGLCGEGFKFTVLFGKIAADWAVGKRPRFDLSRFRATRFSA